MSIPVWAIVLCEQVHCFKKTWKSGGSCNFTTTPELVEECDWGCTNGICDSQPDSCIDTDGGFVVTIQGAVSGYSGGGPYNYTDYCDTNTTLMEYYCSGNQWNSDIFYCTGNFTSCINGKCI